MIDKDLSNLKKDIPTYNIDEYKKDIFKKYNELKTINKKESLFPLKYFISPILIVLIASLAIVFIIYNNDNKVNAYEEDRKLLTQLVYNATIQENEEYEVTNIIKNKKFSNDLYYTSFKVHESFGFTTTFDFVMEPYINDYIIGEEVFVVIALLEFSNEQFYGDAFFQKMIIFSYKDNLVGFMSPYFSSVLTGDFNDASTIENPAVDILYSFQSASFLTKNSVVKYYEKGDTLYSFEFLEYKNGTVELLIDCNKRECKSNIINDSFVELNEDVVIKLIELTYIEKINVNVTIIGFDKEDKNKIYVKSNEISSIETVNYRYSILDSNDNILSHDKLNIGDVIEIYYYDRYETYQPKNITVDNIILINDNNQVDKECINGEHLWLISIEEGSPLPEYRVYNCFYCGKIKVENVNIEDPCENDNHQWDEGVNTYTESGLHVMEYTCNICCFKKQEVIYEPGDPILYMDGLYSGEVIYTYSFISSYPNGKKYEFSKNKYNDIKGIKLNSVKGFFSNSNGILMNCDITLEQFENEFDVYYYELNVEGNIHQGIYIFCSKLGLFLFEAYYHFENEVKIYNIMIGYELTKEDEDLDINGAYSVKLIASSSDRIPIISSLKIEENTLYIIASGDIPSITGKLEKGTNPTMKLGNLFDIDNLWYSKEEDKEIVKQLFDKEEFYSALTPSITYSSYGHLVMELNNELYYIKTYSQMMSEESIWIFKLNKND